MQSIVPWLPTLATGLATTLELTAWVVVVSSLIGLVGGLVLLYGPTPLRQVVRVAVDVIRGIPVLVLIFAMFYGPGAFGYSIDAPSTTVAALSIFAGAHVSEVVRGAVGSIPEAQHEAARMVGLTAWQRMRLVVLPLALPRMVPPWVNTAVEVLKGTSLASLIGISDLLYQTQSVVGSTFNPMAFYSVAALAYFVFAFGLSRIGALAEWRFRYQEY